MSLELAQNGEKITTNPDNSEIIDAEVVGTSEVAPKGRELGHAAPAPELRQSYVRIHFKMDEACPLPSGVKARAVRSVVAFVPSQFYHDLFQAVSWPNIALNRTDMYPCECMEVPDDGEAAKVYSKDMMSGWDNGHVIWGCDGERVLVAVAISARTEVQYLIGRVKSVGDYRPNLHDRHKADMPFVAAPTVLLDQYERDSGEALMLFAHGELGYGIDQLQIEVKAERDAEACDANLLGVMELPEGQSPLRPVGGT